MAKNIVTSKASATVESWKDFLSEVVYELTPPHSFSHYCVELAHLARSSIYVPYFPFLHRPGWLLRYVVGPYDSDYLENLIYDISGGVTVALLLIPQSLSYAALANLPPVVGLYSSILPSVAYIVFGTGMQLAVGPVAVVSLLVGSIVAKWQPDFATNHAGALDTSAQASVSVAIILLGLCVFNLGHFIHLISHPVISGFTSGAAMSIGLSQLKNAFGFIVSTVPQQGQVGYEHNYLVMDWFAKNFNAVFPVVPSTSKDFAKIGMSYTNPYAIKICFGLFIPLVIIMYIKSSIKSTPARKRSWIFRFATLFTSLLPLIAIIIGQSVAKSIINSPTADFYAKNLKIVGDVAPGINIFRIPNAASHPFGSFFLDCIPLSLVLFLESYSISRRLATSANQLHLLNASQELWAVGLANLLCSVSSSYPVSGSFSRSSLNVTSGVRTPLSKAVTLIIVLLALSFLTQTFRYIPQAALAAVVFVSINSLIKVSDVWEAFRHKKRDALLMLITMTITFVFDSGTGLGTGIGASVLFYLSDLAFSDLTSPHLMSQSSSANGEIDIVCVNGDVSWLQSARTKDFIVSLHLSAPPAPSEDKSRNENIFLAITGRMDKFLEPRLIKNFHDRKLPKAVVIDLSNARVIDVTGLIALKESTEDLRAKKILVVVTNATKAIEKSIVKFGIVNDASTEDVNLEEFLDNAGEIPKIFPGEIPKVFGAGEFASEAIVIQEEQEIEAIGESRL